MKNHFFRICSMILVIVLLVNMLPMSIFAEEFQESIANNKAAAENNTTGEGIPEDTYVVSEITENRTEYSKEFLMSNGLHMATVYADAVHYKTENGWEEIDNTLKVNNDGTYSNTAGIWDVSFPDQLGEDESITIEKDGYTLSFFMSGELTTGGAMVMSAGLDEASVQTFTVADAQNAIGEIQQIDTSAMEQAAEHPETVPDKLQSQITYAEVYDNTDIVYDLDSNKVKESMVLESYNADLQGYSYTLEVGSMIPILGEDGSVILYDEEQKNIVMVMPAPYLIDDNGVYNYDIEVQLTGSGSTYTLIYLLPQQWLAADDRAWPVVLDPVIEGNTAARNIQDRTIAENATYAYNGYLLETGYTVGSGIHRAFLKYETLPSITSSDVVVYATMNLYKMETSYIEVIVEAHQVTGEWTSQEITWADQPAWDNAVEDYIAVREQGYYSWIITDIVRDWYATENNGLMFKACDAAENVTESNYKQFASSDLGTAGTKPVLQVYFRNNNGLEGYWDYTTSSAGRAGTGYVNNFTGNLVWVRDDIGFGGNRMPVSISHVYNLNDVITPDDDTNSNDSGGNSFGLGVGWRTNFNQLVYRWEVNDVDKGYYIWEDSDGTDHYFEYDTELGKYSDEDDSELTLTDSGSGTEKYCIADKSGNCSYFDANGRLTKQTNNQQTKSSITITYDGTSNRISMIEDGAGRKYYFSYTSGLLTRISYKGTGSDEISYVSFSYSGSKLTGVTNADGESSIYGYSNNLLSTAEDIDGYTLTYTYNTPSQTWQPYRVKSIEESDNNGTTKGGSLTFEYAHNQTTITDYNGNVEIHQFNDLGNTVSVQDDEGHAQFTQYTKNTDEESGKANQLRLSSKLQNTVGNVLQNNSFESMNDWQCNDIALTASRTTEAAYQGNYSLKLTSTSDALVAGYAPWFWIAPGETYTFSAYVKTLDAVAQVAIHGVDSPFNIYGPETAANQDWNRVEVSYTNDTGQMMRVFACVYIKTAGSAYVDCVQVENAATASRYNLVENGDFRYWSYGWTYSSTLTDDDGIATAEDPAPAKQLDSYVVELTGDPQTAKSISQQVNISGNKGDTYVLAGWAKGDSAPIIDNREFAIVGVFNYTDGNTGEFTARFNPDVDSSVSWQYSAEAMVAEKAYSSITVKIVYDYNVNTVYFDGIQLFKEEFGTSYTYDDDKNIISVKDLQGQITQYDFDDETNSDLQQVIQNGDAQATYVYDNYHNIIKTTTEKLVYNYTYDVYGNNTKVSTSNGSITMESSADYSADGNRLASTTDALGNVTTYNYNAQTNVLEWVQYPEDTEATRTEYTYDSMYRMASAACETDLGGDLSATYTCSDDLLTKIQTGSTTYNFTYSDFSLRTGVSIGSRTLATYNYTDEAERGESDDRKYDLDSLDYGNGDSVEYEYDEKGRVTKETFMDGETEKGTVTYDYDNDGALARVTDSETGITTTYYYDFTERMMKYVESGTGYSHSVGYEYDTLNNLTQLVETINGIEHTTTYTYDEDNRITASTTDGVTVEYVYDDFGRVTTQTTKNGSTVILTESYTYKAPASTTTSDRVATYTTATPNGYSITYTYTYDGNGNITSISDGTNTTTYLYDSANQLVRENNQAGNYTYVWHYDDAGNIVKRMRFAYTADGLEDLQGTVNYTYGDSEWEDLLTGYDGKTFTYDAVGNLTSDGTWTYTWENGRELASMSKGSTTWSYTYDANGMRTGKTNGTNSYSYVYNGSQFSQMTVDSNTLNFTYDANGTPLAVDYNGTTYYYVTNLQGDVTAILDSIGTSVVLYRYDAWGRTLTITGSLKGTLGIQNPLRYRGYVYDQETNLYYLQSRYYNPQIGRFINADDIDFLGASGTLLGYNLFAYCENNPINMIDANGNIASNVLGAIIGGVLGIVGGAFLGKWLANIIGIKKGWARNIFVAGVAALVGASAAAIGYFIGPYVAKAWNYLSAKLAGLVKGSFKGIGRISSAKMSKVNVTKHLWNKVLGKNVTSTNIQSLIYKTIRKGTWKIQSDGIYRIVMQYGKEYIVVTGNIVNGIFKLGDAWVWDRVSNLWGY